MGQCYWVYNKTKNTMIDYDGLLKLTEHSWLCTDLANHLRKLLCNEWKGDKIYHLGEFFRSIENVEYKQIEKSIFITLKDAKKILCRKRNREDDYKYPFVINRTKKIYLDIREAAIDDWEANKDGFHFISLDPLLLLLACGNGLSGSDYYGINDELVGSWAGDELECSETMPNQEIQKVRYIFLSESENEDENYRILSMQVSKKYKSEIIENAKKELPDSFVKDHLQKSLNEFCTE